MVENVNVFPSSRELLDHVKQKADKPQGRKLKYPWRQLSIGESFPVQPGEIKFDSLVSLAYKTSVRLKKRFVVYNHGKDKNENQLPYEVGRVE